MYVELSKMPPKRRDWKKGCQRRLEGGEQGVAVRENTLRWRISSRYSVECRGGGQRVAERHNPLRRGMSLCYSDRSRIIVASEDFAPFSLFFSYEVLFPQWGFFFLPYFIYLYRRVSLPLCFLLLYLYMSTFECGDARVCVTHWRHAARGLIYCTSA